MQRTLRLTGSSHGKTEPRKATSEKGDAVPNEKHNPTSPELSIPPRNVDAIGKSLGFSAVELVLPKGT